MSNPQQETKIELVTEAIEGLVLATVSVMTETDNKRSLRFREDVLDARNSVANALRELLTPVLRVVTTEHERCVGAAKDTRRRVVAEVSNLA